MALISTIKWPTSSIKEFAVKGKTNTVLWIWAKICYRTHKLYYDRPITPDLTVHNRRDMVMLDKNIKEAYVIDVAIPNSHHLYSTIIEKLQKYADLQEQLTRIWQLNEVYIVSSTTGINPNKLYEFDTAKSSPWSIYSHAESDSTQYMPYSTSRFQWLILAQG